MYSSLLLCVSLQSDSPHFRFKQTLPHIHIQMSHQAGGDEMALRRRRHPRTAAPLDNEDLLGEILLRTGFPTTLVRAALVCRCWYHLASNRGFLRRFRELHPPRLLGFYIGSILIRPELVAFLCFVPMLPQPPELAAVVRRMASHNFGTCEVPWIMDSRNGSISPDIVKEEY